MQYRHRPTTGDLYGYRSDVNPYPLSFYADNSKSRSHIKRDTFNVRDNLNYDPLLIAGDALPTPCG